MQITRVFRRQRTIRPPFMTHEGKPLPLGATVTAEGINFAVFSRHATELCLELRTAEGEPITRLDFDPQVNKTGDIWHIEIMDLAPEVYYNFRANGPVQPEKGQRFSWSSLLLDPYTRVVAGAESWAEHESWPARWSGIGQDDFDWQGDRQLGIPLEETIVYELHVRGFTRHLTAAVEHPGTFRGLIDKIPYLVELGITAVELMPVCEFEEMETTRVNPRTGERLKNFWGYSSIAFFAPKASYAAYSYRHGQVTEFKELVRAFHRAGIEVILDMVFNHTAEGNGEGPSLSFRGLADGVYYTLSAQGEHLNFTGCGNTVQCNHPVVQDLILDCLRYWVMEMHVDGFRFDLASIFCRGEEGRVLTEPPLVERIAKDPVLSKTKLIAEAWDAGGLYQVGTFPAWGRWAEWNGKYRDHLRDFLCGRRGTVPHLATRLIGSPDIYQASDRRPGHSINFITCHDGFTLADLFSYERKHNEDNGEDNRDGSDDNRSCHGGVEGPTSDPSLLELRQRLRKNALTLLLVSQGTPMILAGDEFGRTQQGNNNAYCQDNEISWVNWNGARQNHDFLRFTRELIAFRKRHSVLRQRRFLKPGNVGQPGELSWHGVRLHRPDWGPDSHSLAFLLDGEKAPTKDVDLLVLINGYWEALTFELPRAPSGRRWKRTVDTAQAAPQDIVREEQTPPLEEQANYQTGPHSVVVLVSG